MRRLLVVISACLAMLSAGATVTPAAASWWACVAIDVVDLGACLGNPVPSEVPAAPVVI